MTEQIYTHAGHLAVEICCSCGVAFAMPTTLQKAARRDSKQWFYCPNGHRQHYSESETDKLRRERDRLKQDNAYQAERRREAEERAEHERRRANGYKGHAVKLGKRAKAGVCPCCNRTVRQLAQHMATEHPTFQPETAADEAAPA